jgi:hypothetical protein
VNHALRWHQHVPGHHRCCSRASARNSAHFALSISSNARLNGSRGPRGNERLKLAPYLILRAKRNRQRTSHLFRQARLPSLLLTAEGGKGAPRIDTKHLDCAASAVPGGSGDTILNCGRSSSMGSTEPRGEPQARSSVWCPVNRMPRTGPQLTEKVVPSETVTDNETGARLAEVVGEVQACSAGTCVLAAGLSKVTVYGKKDRPESGGARQFVIHRRVLRRCEKQRSTPLRKIDPLVRLFEGNFLGRVTEVAQDSRNSDRLTGLRTTNG